MIINNGQVIAIDQVLHDSTLSGDGRTIPLGVISGGNTPIYDAGEWLSLSATNKNLTWKKTGGTDLDYTKLSGTYRITTQIAIVPKEPVAELVESKITVDKFEYPFTIDEYAPVQWFTFETIAPIVGKLNTKYEIDNTINFSAYQHINSLVSKIVSGGITDISVNPITLTGNGTEESPIGLKNNIAISAEYNMDTHRIVFDWVS